MSAEVLKYKDESWDFRTADTKEYTHCFHTYPAMMIPQIARRLLNQYGVEGEWLLDPYCGTGTSLVEASLFGMHSVGCDINPLVRLIATAKLTPIPLKTLDSELKKLNDALFQIEFGVDKLPDVPIPKIPNLEYWFSAAKHGFSHKETIVRNIPNKRMPKKNSPSNIAGQTSTTMHEEYIVICQRTDQTCP